MTTDARTDQAYLMHGLTVQHYRFTVRAQEAIILEDQPGSALRGALYQALSERFCSEPGSVITPDHKQRCPVCWLLALEDDQAERGRDLPRPLTVEPPEARVYHRGETLRFGFTLIGKAQNLFPYLARAIQRMGELGVGRGRGRFQLLMISEHNPLLDAERDLMSGNFVQQPTLAVTPARIAEQAAASLHDRITVEFRTPLRLIANGKLLKTPEPGYFIQRLLERCQTIATYYAETDAPPLREDWQAAAQALQATAGTLAIGYDDTQWADHWSGSKRQGRKTPIGGLVGVVRWEGDVTSLRPWLLWGQSLHVGKDAVKGNGWYQVKA